MIRLSTEIQLTVSRNPHRWGSMDWRRFNLIQILNTELGRTPSVGEYIVRHNALGNVGNTWNAKRYLRYMVERSQMTLPGVTFTRRAPRDRAPANLAPIAVDLNDFTFGVELECYLPRGVSAQEIAAQLVAVGVDTRVETLSHTARTWWKIVTDGSLHDYNTGREFVSPPLSGQEGLRQVELVCRKLSSLGCKVNKHCGLHVHVGQEANSNNAAYFSRLLQLYRWNENAIDTIMAPSRRGSYGGNGFCGAVREPSRTATTVAEVCRSVGATGSRSAARYRKLNVDCWWSQRTVEFRQHQGTVEADKTCNWVQFCLRFAALAASNQELPRQADLPTLLTALGLSDELQTFFKNRAAYFAARMENRRAA
jgi:Putative amidoligase enzyme